MSSISDRDIQAYLDGTYAGDIREFEQLLWADSDACERLEQYRTLYEKLDTEPADMLSPNYSDAVMQRIPARRAAFSVHPVLQYVLYASIAAAGFAGLSWYLDGGASLRALKLLFAGFNLSWIKSVYGVFFPAGGEYVLFGVAVLAVVWGIDRYYFRRKSPGARPAGARSNGTDRTLCL